MANEDRSPLAPLPHGQGAVAYRAVLLAALLLVLGLLFRQVLTLLLAMLITVILALPLISFTDLLERHRVPRPVGAVLGLLLGLGVLAALLALVVPTLVEQGRTLAQQLPEALQMLQERVAEQLGREPAEVADRVQEAVAGFVDAGLVRQLGVSLVSAVAGILLVLITAVYIAARPEPLVTGIVRLFPPDRRDWAAAVMARLREAWLGWLKGSVVDAVAVGVLTYVGLLVIGVDYAIVFAVLTGLLEFVPYIGPIIAAIPAVLFAAAESLQTGVLTLVLYVVVHQVEGNLLVPLVMSRAVQLHPAVVAVGIVVVGALFGVVGLFVATPIISAVVILVEELWVKPREARARAP